MKFSLCSFLRALPVAVGACAASVAWQPATAQGTQAPAEQRVIVKFKDGSALARRVMPSAAPEQQRDELTRRAVRLGQRHGWTVSAGAGLDGLTQALRVAGIPGAPNATGEAVLARLRADPDILWAVPDRRVKVRAEPRIPNDPLYGLGGPDSGLGPDVGQWYLRAPTTSVPASIDMPAAWGVTTGNTGTTGVVVAVVDTGVRGEHPDLAGKLLAGYDFVSDVPTANDGNGRDADPSDPGDWVTDAETNTAAFEDCDASSSSWHGTQMAGLVGALTDDGSGMAGAGWSTRVLPVRALGKCGGFDSDVIAGMRWSAGLSVPGVPANPNPAQIVNLSLGSVGACTQAYADAVAEIRGAGSAVVVAAGNTAGRAVNAPGNCAGVIAVTALGHRGAKVGFSDLGPEISISAPGGNCVNTGVFDPCLYPMLSTTNSGNRQPQAGGSTYTNSINYAVGTSYSAPLVSATAALALAVQPGLLPDELLLLLRSTARAFPNSGLTTSSGSPLPTCRTPNNADQLQCYCTTSLCGAGMLDAGAAVERALGVFARVTVQTEAPTAGQTLALTAADSLLASGRNIGQIRWALVNGGGAVTGFSGDTTAVSTTLLPTGPGTVVVSVTVVDDLGQTATTNSSIVVTGTTTPPPAGGGGSGGGSSDSGGGAFDPAWLLALAAGIWALRRAGPPSRKPG